MAKKINFKTIDEVQRASNALKDCHVEHVLVEYPEHIVRNRTCPAKAYIVVLNKYLNDAKAAYQLANLTETHIKNQRHYEWTALTHNHFMPVKK